MAQFQAGSGCRRDALIIAVGSDGAWSGTSDRVRPEHWVTAKAEPDIAHSVLAAESEQSPDGGFGYPAG